jgi:uncharacterized protein (TIGR03067 family)
MFASLLLAAAVISGQPAVAGEKPAAKPVDSRQQARDDLEKLQGTWMRVEMEVEGKAFPLDPDEEWTASYKGDLLTLARGGKPYQTNSIVTLDPAQTPKAMNTWNTEGDTKDKTWPGIYEIDGDTLKVCFAKPGANRPTEFTTNKGTGYLYVEYKRKK